MSLVTDVCALLRIHNAIFLSNHIATSNLTDVIELETTNIFYMDFRTCPNGAGHYISLTGLLDKQLVPLISFTGNGDRAEEDRT